MGHLSHNHMITQSRKITPNHAKSQKITQSCAILAYFDGFQHVRCIKVCTQTRDFNGALRKMIQACESSIILENFTISSLTLLILSIKANLNCYFVEKWSIKQTLTSICHTPWFYSVCLWKLLLTLANYLWFIYTKKLKQSQQNVIRKGLIG